MRVYMSHDDGALYQAAMIEVEMSAAEIAERYDAYEITHNTGVPPRPDEPMIIYPETFAQGQASLAEVLIRGGYLRRVE